MPTDEALRAAGKILELIRKDRAVADGPTIAWLIDQHVGTGALKADGDAARTAAQMWEMKARRALESAAQADREFHAAILESNNLKERVVRLERDLMAELARQCPEGFGD